ncbi:MAG: hypothetical protein LBU45_03895 [Azoarcus sp.]|jgi:hypothetical protein|nr:hypothetical protein [Azoarcus sp.]
MDQLRTQARSAVWYFLLFVFVVFQPLICEAADGEVKFGTGVSKDWQIENEGIEFDTNLISCGFFSPKPYGVMSVTLSIYYQAPGATNEEVLIRENQDVNPEWNILVVPELPLPSTGKYTFSLSRPTGEAIASGSVSIKEKKVEEKMPEQPKVEGTTLEGLFNKFKPKN